MVFDWQKEFESNLTSKGFVFTLKKGTYRIYNGKECISVMSETLVENYIKWKGMYGPQVLVDIMEEMCLTKEK